MAAIVPVAFEGSYKVLRNVSAQATTGQTDWVNVPAWATGMIVYFNVTAVAGTTPSSQCFILEADPVVRDDSTIVFPAGFGGATAVTAAVQVVMHVGPGITGLADDTTGSATLDSVYKINTILPPMLGFRVTNDRTEADETYTYTLAVKFKKF